MNQMISTGIPGTLGRPDLKLSTNPACASQFRMNSKASPEKIGARKSSPTASRIPRSCVAPPVKSFSPTSVAPRRMKSPANVTIKEGSPVLITISPFAAPSMAANSNVSGIARMSGMPILTVNAPKSMPVKATIDPIDRSNSPPIISRAAAMPRMPS